MVAAHAGLEHGHALSQPWVYHHEGSQTNGVTVGRPITGRTSGRPYRHTPRGTTAGLQHHRRPFLYWDAERDMIRRLTGVNAEPTDSENQSGSGGSVFKRHRQKVRVGCAHSH